jgi:hypothetical protein
VEGIDPHVHYVVFRNSPIVLLDTTSAWIPYATRERGSQYFKRVTLLRPKSCRLWELNIFRYELSSVNQSCFLFHLLELKICIVNNLFSIVIHTTCYTYYIIVYTLMYKQ